MWCLNFGGLLVNFCLVCFPFVKTIIPISTSYIYFINYFILFVKFTCLYGLNGVIFVYTIRENKMKNLTLYRLLSLPNHLFNEDLSVMYFYENGRLYDTDEYGRKSTSHRMSKLNLTILDRVI